MATVSSSFVPGEWQEALQAIDQAVRQFGEYGVTQDELDREITSFRARYENAVKSASTRDSVALAGKLVYAVNDRQVFAARSEERRVGKECVSKCRYRGGADH